MIEYTLDADTLTCSFSGHLDWEGSKKVRDELGARLADAPGSVVFDLAGVEYISSEFLGLCVHVCRRVGADALTVTNAPPPIKRVFKIARLDTVMTIK